MGVTALVMAGGKATRMKSTTEKPLIEVGGRTMIELVVDALKHSKTVDRIIVAVSGRTPKTSRKAREMNTEIVETPGDDYVSDMRYVVRKLGLREVLIVSADIPFITAEIVDQAVERYRSCGKPALSVMSPVSIHERLGSRPEYVFDIDGRSVAPIGINILDGRRIDEPELDQAVLVTEAEEFALNVNTPNELEIAREHLKKTRGTSAYEKGP